MDSTPNPNPNPNPTSSPSPSPSQLHLSIKASARKLPIKRKNPDSSSSSNPNPNPNPLLLIPKLDSTADDDDYDAGTGGDLKPPPFKFHRIWTEPDEIRFLQGLLSCSSEGLSFPRDLNVFYARFSGTMSQPYTKSQLSEKLRRLRKKFRVISSRLAKGLDKALLSPHDRALYELSEQLWHPDYSSTSPFGSNSKGNKSSLVGVKVSFSPNLPNHTLAYELNDNTNNVSNCVDIDNNDEGLCGGLDVDGDVKLSEVNVEFEDGVVGEEELPVPSGSGGGIGQVAAKAAIDVFDESLKEVRVLLVRQGLLNPEHCGSNSAGSLKEVKEESIEKRWREQRVAELDVLARRLRLVVEHSLQRE